MNINIFKLEEYLSKYEFTAPYLLCCSDSESFKMCDILKMANDEERDFWNNLQLGYTETRGLPRLRENIANNLYPKLNKDNILCFAGAEEGIFCSLLSICNPKDHVIILTPCYQSLKEIPISKGCDISEIELLEKDDWKINISSIEAAIKTNTKCLIINFPHNPTGQVISQDELINLIKLLKKHDIWLFSDEVYRLLGMPDKGWSEAAACEYEKAISLGVMSKSFGLAGLRIGWIACQNVNIIKKIEEMKHYTSICNSAPSEILALIALNNKEQILSRNNKILSENLALLENFINKYNNLFSWVKPQGGCVGFVKLNSSENVDDFCNRLIKTSGVLLMPDSIYDVKSNHFRIGFGRSNMKQALLEFENFLNL